MPVDNNLYNRTGDIWWDEDQPLSTLRTMVNPARLEFFHTILRDDLHLDPRGFAALDVGCGGGLLAEELARLGLLVTGVDPSHASVATARRHAAQSGLTIQYVAGTGEQVPFASACFDAVFCCDVLEHVEDLDQVIAEISRVLKPRGVFLYDTINRTLRSKIAVIKFFQEWDWTSCSEPNLHDWDKFIKPRDLLEIMARYGIEHRVMVGMRPQGNPFWIVRQMRKRKRGLISHGELGRRIKMRLTRDRSISYIGYAVKR